MLNSKLLNAKNQIIKWPKKNAEKLEVLKFLYSKFELEVFYTEKEVNFIINQNISFDGAGLLRRSLIDQGFMDREIDGSKYWLLESGKEISLYKVNG